MCREKKPCIIAKAHELQILLSDTSFLTIRPLKLKVDNYEHPKTLLFTDHFCLPFRL
jgi:hypothetical protein